MEFIDLASTREIFYNASYMKNYIKKTEVSAIMSFLKAVGLYGKIKKHNHYNINNTKEYKNKWVSGNYCTPWISTLRYEDLETNKLSSKWLDSALNDR